MFWKLPDIARVVPETIFYIGPLPVTNTLFCTWLSILVLVIFFYFGTRKRALIPSGIQSVTEVMVEYLLGLVESVSGKEKAKKFFPLVATFFLFIIVANMLDIFPGVDTVGVINLTQLHDIQRTCQQQTFLGFLPNCQPAAGFLLFGNVSNAVVTWIRPATTDLNLTFAMALVSVVTCQVFGFYTLGAKEHLSKYFNFKALFKFRFSGLIEFFVGLLEVISEVSRIISFSFRLFGNIFAGSAVLAVFAFILPFIADIAFIPLEIFVAAVQALVFALLTLVFLEIATTGHDTHEDESEHQAHEDFQRNEARARETAAATH